MMESSLRLILTLVLAACCDISTQSRRGSRRIGCFLVNNTVAPEMESKLFREGVAKRKCRNYCYRHEKTTYFGIQRQTYEDLYAHCFCTNRTDLERALVGDFDCKYRCGQSSTTPGQHCGGQVGGIPYMSLYSVCEVGYFAENTVNAPCTQNCHCGDSQVCRLADGRCQSPGCKFGWSGPACDVFNLVVALSISASALFIAGIATGVGIYRCKVQRTRSGRENCVTVTRERAGETSNSHVSKNLNKKSPVAAMAGSGGRFGLSSEDADLEQNYEVDWTIDDFNELEEFETTLYENEIVYHQPSGVMCSHRSYEHLHQVNHS